MPPENTTDAVIDRFLNAGDTSNEAETPAGDDTTTETADEGTPDTETQGQDTQPQSGDDAAQRADNRSQPGSDKKRPTDPNARQQGDIVDPRTGQVIRAGGERRQYEYRMRAESSLRNTQAQLQRVQTELEAFRQAAQAPGQYKLSPDETVQGIQLMAAWKQNPVETVKYLLEQAKALGHNIEGITGGVTDMGAIKRMIEEATAPLRSQQEREQSEHQARAAAQTEMDTFISHYGREGIDANGNVLADVMNRAAESGRPITLEVAWNRFETWCLRNQLDPYQPINPQMAARQSGNNGQGNPASPGRPQGRPASAMQPHTAARDPVNASTGNERNADIVRNALRESGIQI